MTVIWFISLLIIWIVTTVNTGTSIIGVEIPNIWIRVLGVAELIALPFLGFTTVKRIQYKKEIKYKKDKKEQGRGGARWRSKR